MRVCVHVCEPLTRLCRRNLQADLQVIYNSKADVVVTLVRNGAPLLVTSCVVS